MADVDISAEAVERLAHDCDGHAQWLRDRTPEGGTAGLAEIYGRIAATLRALLARAEAAEGRCDLFDTQAAAAKIMAANAEAQRDAALAERDRLAEALARAEQQLDYGQYDAAQDILRAALASIKKEPTDGE